MNLATHPLQTTAINRIMTLTGEVPDADRYRNYLASLKDFELQARLEVLEGEKSKPSSERWNVTLRH